MPTDETLVRIFRALEEEPEAGMETVARATCYSRYHLHRLFANATGLSIREYLWRRRHTRTARLLNDTDASVLEIALACAGGEPMKSCFSSRELVLLLEKHGFLPYEELSPRKIQRGLIGDERPGITAFEHSRYLLAVKKG